LARVAFCVGLTYFFVQACQHRSAPEPQPIAGTIAATCLHR